MMLFVIILSMLVVSSVQGETNAPEPDLRDDRVTDGRTGGAIGAEDKTFKMSKKGLAYLIAGLVLKGLVFIKIALAKLTILGNISIMISKLSLILSLLLTFGKYFGGISKMLKLKTVGYDGQHHGYYTGLGNQGNYFI